MDAPSPLLLLVIVPIAVVAVPKVFDAVIEVIRRRRERDPASGPTRPRIVDPHEISDFSSLAGAIRTMSQGQEHLFERLRASEGRLESSEGRLAASEAGLRACEEKHDTCTERVGVLEAEVQKLNSLLSPELRRTLGIDP